LQEHNPRESSRLKRIVLIGDHNQLPPIIKNIAFQKFSHLDRSLFTRFVRLGIPTVELDSQGRARPSISALYNWRYKVLKDLPVVIHSEEYQLANAGIIFDYQLIDVEDYAGNGEMQPSPFYYQNLGEAEYIVAFYMYLRLIGYPSNRITILTTYRGQKHLIRDILNVRCPNGSYYGKPKLTTVDRYQGQQNDVVLLSLVRTRAVGHIRDIRRLVVAMSRARLGLYVFCRKSLFENCYELTPTFSKLIQRPSKLQLVENETYPTTRKLTDPVQPFEVQDVVHMGQLVKVLEQNSREKIMEAVARIEAEKSADTEMEETTIDSGLQEEIVVSTKQTQSGNSV